MLPSFGLCFSIPGGTTHWWTCNDPCLQMILTVISLQRKKSMGWRGGVQEGINKLFLTIYFLKWEVRFNWERSKMETKWVNMLMPSHAPIMGILKIKCWYEPGLEFLISGEDPVWCHTSRGSKVFSKFLLFQVIIIYAEEVGSWFLVIIMAVIQWCAGKYANPWFATFARADFQPPWHEGTDLEVEKRVRTSQLQHITTYC